MLKYKNIVPSSKGEMLTLVTPTPLTSIIKNNKSFAPIPSFYKLYYDLKAYGLIHLQRD